MNDNTVMQCCYVPKSPLYDSFVTVLKIEWLRKFFLDYKPNLKAKLTPDVEIALHTCSYKNSTLEIVRS